MISWFFYKKKKKEEGFLKGFRGGGRGIFFIREVSKKSEIGNIIF
jgi:hypothetical protein